MAEAKRLAAPYELVRQVARTGKLPVPNFAAGGVATPADAALMMSSAPRRCSSAPASSRSDRISNRTRRGATSGAWREAIVKAVTNYNRPDVLAESSEGLPQAMRGLSMEAIPGEQQLAKRGW